MEQENNILHVGEYSLPDDCTCRIVKRKVVVTKKVLRKIQPEDYRCKDCKKQIVGKCLKTIWYDTKVCSAKPKSIYGNKQIYYAAPDTMKSCGMFELKDNE